MKEVFTFDSVYAIRGDSLVAQTAKNLTAMRETWVRSLGQEDPLEKKMVTQLQYSCLENPHGQRSLGGYSPWGCQELETPEITKHSTDVLD